MPHQLTADCLNEIFGYLEYDKANLRSCLVIGVKFLFQFNGSKIFTH